jgi:hypothetical protein
LFFFVEVFFFVKTLLKIFINAKNKENRLNIKVEEFEDGLKKNKNILADFKKKKNRSR